MARLPDVPVVLLVDSTDDDRMMYAEYLRACGFRPTEVDNTSDALIAATAVDVVVTGIRVKGPFDGLELIRRLRASERTHAAPVITLTACAFAADQQRAQAAGCDQFLAKPCLPERLVSEIRRILTHRTPGARPGHRHPLQHRNRRAS